MPGFAQLIHELDLGFINVFFTFQGCFFLIVLSASVFIFEDSFHGKVKYVDPCVSLVSIFILLATSGPMFREATLILLQTIPEKMDVVGFKNEILKKFPEVILNVHETHIWCLVPGNIVVTMHAIFKDQEVRPKMRKTIASGFPV